MQRKKVLLIGGSLNQTKITHAVGRALSSRYDCFYSSAFCDGVLDILRKAGALEFTVLGERLRLRSDAYLISQNLAIDYAGNFNSYDLIVSTSDLIVQKKLSHTPVVLIQEGMTDPEDWRYSLVRYLHLPRWIAGTAANGLSDAYSYFCVASPGYRDLFIQKGCRPEKVVVTGLPNFDDVQSFCKNAFHDSGYVLVATSNARETYKPDSRQAFIKWAIQKAAGRRMIFKLHPAENFQRARSEIQAVLPNATIFTEGNTDHMIANCDALITQYSTCVYVGMALNKECHSYFDLEMLKKLMPVQNGGQSGKNIAQFCVRLLEEQVTAREKLRSIPLFGEGD